jgi:glycosyltransferase involved in cell wall biosynthesis
MGVEIHYASNFKNPIYTFDKQKLIDNGIVLHQVDIEKNPASTKNFKAIKQIKNIIDDEQIDAVSCHNPMGGVAGRIAARISKRKPYVIYTAHGFHFYKGAPTINWMLYYTAEKFLARWTDELITINDEDYRRACKFHLKKNGRVDKIHGVGVDDERFVPIPNARETMRAELGVEDDAFVMVTAAELRDNKNHIVVLKAIRNLINEMDMTDKKIYYLLCGKGPNRVELEDLAKEYGIDDIVKFLGFRTDMHRILQAADCFIFPSIREGLGIAAVEALLCGVPLVVADNRGTKEYALDGVNSFVCASDSDEEFEAAIRKMISDKKQKQIMADCCRESASIFTVREVEKTMKRVYEGWLNL